MKSDSAVTHTLSGQRHETRAEHEGSKPQTHSETQQKIPSGGDQT